MNRGKTKIELAREIVNSEYWDGYTKDPQRLARESKKYELEDLYEWMLSVEYEEDMLNGY